MYETLEQVSAGVAVTATEARAVVNGVTLIGAAISGLGCVYRLPVLLLVGVALDALDGRLARRWGVASEGGARLDWTADVAVTAWSAAVFLPSPAVPVLIAWQLQNAADRMSSGRALVAAVAALLSLPALAQL